MQIGIVKTDGGKKAAGFTDRNDCTVRALAILTEAPYALAHEFFRLHGRVKDTGAYVGFLMRTEFNGFQFKRLARPHSTVRRYIAEHSEGRYMIEIGNPGHIFTVIDGTVYDTHPLCNLLGHYVEYVIVLKQPQKLLTNKR